MRRVTPLLPVLAAALLMAGCGSERVGSLGGGAGATPRTSVSPVSDPGLDGVRITGLTLPSPSTPGIVSADSSPVSAAYEVVNDSSEALTYTILFDFTTAAGEAVTNTRQTVRDVGPGRTVRGTVDMPPTMASGQDVNVTRVKVSEVTSTRDYRVEGYPQLTLLDEDREPVDGVRILQGSGGISSAVTGFDDPPRPMTLKPGERARSGLVWRNTTEAGLEPVNAPYVRVRAEPGAAPVIVTPHLDLGTTGKLGVSPWRPEE